MRPDKSNADSTSIDDVVKRCLPSAPVEHMESDAARVLHRLQSTAGQAADPVEDQRFADPVRASVPGWLRIGIVFAAAVVLLAVIVSPGLWRRSGGLAVVENVDGSLYQIVEGKTRTIPVGQALKSGQMVRTNGGAGAMLALADGSRVEMRSQSELSLERADDGMRIRLATGSIIVNAAKQPSGHLYVQTKDMTVTVVGTVFLVNAEKEGSRVAVIEGEVRVQERATETKLRPGEQVSTSPTLAARSVKEEIAWSRQADMYLSILAAFERGMADTAGSLRPLANTSVQGTPNQAGAAAGQAFEEASIRPCDPDNLPPAPAGARGGGANSFQMTPGRSHVLCMTLATIIRHAYGYGPADLDFTNQGGRGRGLQLNNVYGLGVEDGRRVRGGPDWVRSDRYTIEAVADGATDAATMSGAMMRELLERRLQLKLHVETEQVPAFALSVAKGGLKIKPVTPGACDSLPARPGSPLENGQPLNVLAPPRNFADVRRGEKPSCGLWTQRNGPNMVFVGGDVAVGQLTQLLGFRLGAIRVLDKTGLTDRFNFLLEFVLDENSPGPGVPGAELRDPAAAADVPKAATIFTAIEEQLGLKLEPARTPREFIVIDRVERPSPN